MPKYPSRDEWIKKMWSLHTMERYSTLMRKEEKEIPPFVKTWVKLEDTALTEIRQTRRDKHCMILSGMWNLKPSNSWKQRLERWWLRVGRRENGKMLVKHQDSVTQDEKVLRI